ASWRLGSTRFMDELQVDLQALRAQAQALEAQGRTISWVSQVDEQATAGAGQGAPRLLGLLAFGDTVKASATRAVKTLHALGIETVMVSGDNQGSAQAVATQLGLDAVRANVLPEHKADIIAE